MTVQELIDKLESLKEDRRDLPVMLIYKDIRGAFARDVRDLVVMAEDNEAFAVGISTVDFVPTVVKPEVVKDEGHN